MVGYTCDVLSLEEVPKMPKTRRHNSSRVQFWRDTIIAWKASGQSVRAFCAARGLNEATFYLRRRELADRRPRAWPHRRHCVGLRTLV